MAHLSKKQKRCRDIEKNERPKLPLGIKKLNPITLKQKQVFNSFYNDNHLFLYGVAGTGKSFISMYLALEQILSGLSTVEHLIIIRSAVQTRQQGFLPGKSKEKMEDYEVPYESICTALFEKDDAYRTLKSKHVIHFMSTSFLRSLTFDNAIIFVDEAQNLTAHELDTVATRVGKNSKIIISGDCRQEDLEERKERSGLPDFMRIAQDMKGFSFIEFGVEDIVRSGFVKQYMKTRIKLEDNGSIERL